MNKQYMEDSSVKGTFESLFNGLEESIQKMPGSVKEAIYNDLGRKLENLARLANECHTPIEFLLAAELENDLEALNLTGPIYHEIFCQSSIWVNGKKYRVDLLINSLPYQGDEVLPKLIIECDGHDFHEKTKEQSRSDKQRDRDLQMAGYRILRFTGSEIVKSPRRCATDIIRFMEQIFYEE
jgi:hypothetical protein